MEKFVKKTKMGVRVVGHVGVKVEVIYKRGSSTFWTL